MELRAGIYIVMACAFGACVEDDEPNYCTKEQAACVCKPTLKLDMSSVEPPSGSRTPLCNNATFDWMVGAMLVQMSHLNQRITDLDTERQKHKAEIADLQGLNRDLNEVVRIRDEEVRSLLEGQRVLQEKLQQRPGGYSGGAREDLELQISDLEKVKRKLEFENIRLQERNDIANQELETFKERTKPRPRDCADIQREGSRYSGVYTIYPQGASQQKGPFSTQGAAGAEDGEGAEVFCDLHTDGGGWLMVQRRQDGSQRFDLDWNSYKLGFGKVAREFWIGNDLLHRISNQGEYELRVDMMDVSGLNGHAHYTHFRVDNEASGYKLHVNGYSGTVGDALDHHDDAPFSTLDVDNDASRSGHCSTLYGGGGWWFVCCYDSNLNGRYGRNDKTGVEWFQWKDHHLLRHVEMKIRPTGIANKRD